MSQILTPSQKKSLKAKAHHLKPVVIIGDKGLSLSVTKETHIALTAHELIKVRINAINREERHKIAEELSEGCDAALVQMIGHIAVLYRKNPEK